MKICSKCKETMPFSEFNHDWHAKDGYISQCKTCRKAYIYAYRARSDKKAIIAAIDARSHQKNKNKPSYRLAQKRNLRRWIEKSPRFNLYMALKHAVKRRLSPDPITLDQLMEMWREQNGLCAISGQVMTWSKGQLMPTSISLDRIDQTKGYVVGNVRLVCYQANTFRGRWDDAQMLVMAKAIVDNMGATARDPDHDDDADRSWVGALYPKLHSVARIDGDALQ